MRKMKYSYGKYIVELCDELNGTRPKDVREKREQLANRIKDIADSGAYKKSSSYWKTTDEDKLYLQFLDKLSQVVRNGFVTEQVNEVKKRVIDCTEEKIKIVFFTQETTCWPSYESLYVACLKDERLITQLVYIPFTHVNANSSIDHYKIYCEEFNLPILRHEQYLLSEENPDIAVFMKPYDGIPEQWRIENVAPVVPRTVYIQYGMEVSQTYLKYHFQLFFHYKVWVHVAYGELVKENAKRFGYKNGENVEVWGNPRADYYRDLDAHRSQIPKSWQTKIQNRKVVLWTPHHAINEGQNQFLKYGEMLLSYFEKNNDVVLLLRPHPLLWGSLVNGGYYTLEMCGELVERLKRSNNLILDSTSDYRDAFYASDALISGGYTFLFEYLYMGKPILYLKSDNEAVYNEEMVTEALYSAQNFCEIAHFLEGLKEEKDPLKVKRQLLKEKLLFVPEQNTGEYIRDRIIEKLNSELEQKKLGE